MKQSTAWKSLEHRAAELFGGHRVTRGDDFSNSRPDVLVSDTWSIECKSRTKLALWEWVTKLKSDTEKFFKDENRIKVIVTKKKGCHGEVFLITSEDFFKILDPKLKKEIDDRNKKIKEEVNGNS